MSGLGFIAIESPRECEMCGDVDECRPYGPNDEQICFDCGMLNEETTRKKMESYIFGDKQCLN